MVCTIGFLVFALSFAQAQRQFDSGNHTGLPVYPNAKVREGGKRGTVSLTAGGTAHRLAATKYVSQDSPEKVLQFYRAQLKSLGNTIECTGGKNLQVDVQLTDASLSDSSACNAADFAAGGTELKVISNGEQRIVVLSPQGRGTEIALVRVKP
jgi:hypothetical protein